MIFKTRFLVDSKYRSVCAKLKQSGGERETRKTERKFLITVSLLGTERDQNLIY